MVYPTTYSLLFLPFTCSLQLPTYDLRLTSYYFYYLLLTTFLLTSYYFYYLLLTPYYPLTTLSTALATLDRRADGTIPADIACS